MFGAIDTMILNKSGLNKSVLQTSINKIWIYFCSGTF
ncbi:MAG: hypothetical protein JWO32_2040, partial [Bacteroidetes bacterium]|nr:hypothetical protein [Bacteroidota bacterium]